MKVFSRGFSTFKLGKDRPCPLPKGGKMAKKKHYDNEIVRLTNLFPVKGKGKLMIGSIRGEYFDTFTDDVQAKALKKKTGISFLVNKFGDDWVLSAVVADKFKGGKNFKKKKNNYEADREREREREEDRREEREDDDRRDR